MGDFEKLQRLDRWRNVVNLVRKWQRDPLRPVDGYDDDAIAAAEKRLKLRFPCALREWFALCGWRMSEVHNPWNADELTRLDNIKIRNGVLLFYGDSVNGVFGIPEARFNDIDPFIVSSSSRGWTPHPELSLSKACLLILVYRVARGREYMSPNYQQVADLSLPTVEGLRKSYHALFPPGDTFFGDGETILALPLPPPLVQWIPAVGKVMRVGVAARTPDAWGRVEEIVRCTEPSAELARAFAETRRLPRRKRHQ